MVECVYGESSLTAVCLKKKPKKTNYGLIKTAPFCEKTSVRCPTKNIDRNPHDTNLRHNYHTSVLMVMQESILVKNFSTSKFLSFKLPVNCFTSWQCTYFCFVVLGIQQRENVQRKSSESFMVSCLSPSSFSIYSCSNHSHHTHHPYHSNNTEES